VRARQAARARRARRGVVLGRGAPRARTPRALVRQGPGRMTAPLVTMVPQAAPNPGPARPALFEAHEARVAVDGVVAVDRLSVVTAGDRVVLAGDAGALLAAITGAPRVAGGGARIAVGGMDGAALPGEASVVAGTLLLAGKSVAEGAHVR